MENKFRQVFEEISADIKKQNFEKNKGNYLKIRKLFENKKIVREYNVRFPLFFSQFYLGVKKRFFSLNILFTYAKKEYIFYKCRC